MHRHLHLLNLLSRNAKRGEFRADASSNTIYLYDFIVGSDEEADFWGGVSPGNFARQLAAMSGPVHLRINSPGGEVFAARAMAQAIREYPGDVICHVDGLAASAATTVAIAGNRVVMAPDALFMIHNAWTIALGNADDFRDTAGVLDKIDAGIRDAYAAKSGKADAAAFAGMMAAETWFSAQEAADLGLCDEIAGDEPAKAEPKASAKAWDLSAYKAAPKPTAEGGVVTEPGLVGEQPSEITIKLNLDASGFRASLEDLANRVREVADTAPGAEPVAEPAPAAPAADEKERRIRAHAARLALADPA